MRQVLNKVIICLLLLYGSMASFAVLPDTLKFVDKLNKTNSWIFNGYGYLDDQIFRNLENTKVTEKEIFSGFKVPMRFQADIEKENILLREGVKGTSKHSRYFGDLSLGEFDSLKIKNYSDDFEITFYNSDKSGTEIFSKSTSRLLKVDFGELLDTVCMKYDQSIGDSVYCDRYFERSHAIPINYHLGAGGFYREHEYPTDQLHP